MGGLGRTPILRQKQLKDKTVKNYHGRQYKKGLFYAQWNNKNKGSMEENEGKEEKNTRKIRGKQVRKGVKDKRKNKKLRKEKGIRKEKQRVSKSVMVGMDQ